ncbi:hypothetical protein RM844_10340 [Streptomyces sp. DSM 44915]|uniref:WXG100 family type VII secretion target n=1 Tax=Streptomyces chisholmiae TaxID=3075540 RepID=A0ABU2JPN2_9ACTN|nr:hypothetical protein [Streptomyces sp. DSM 44915]MDT0266691.1 hypothetical protein [Streptomyces sp. DSM 44915]
MSDSDVYLDYDQLSTNRDNIRNIANLLRGPCQSMANVNGAEMGVHRLERKMDDFGDEWEYGIGKLAEFSDAAADALDEVLAGFREVDEELSRAFQEA